MLIIQQKQARREERGGERGRKRRKRQKGEKGRGGGASRILRWTRQNPDVHMPTFWEAIMNGYLLAERSRSVKLRCRAGRGGQQFLLKEQKKKSAQFCGGGDGFAPISVSAPVLAHRDSSSPCQHGGGQVIKPRLDGRDGGGGGSQIHG